jgi:hypothetical protein
MTARRLLHHHRAPRGREQLPARSATVAEGSDAIAQRRDVRYGGVEAEPACELTGRPAW